VSVTPLLFRLVTVYLLFSIFIHLSIHPSVHSSKHLSIYASIYLSIYLYSSIHLDIYWRRMYDYIRKLWQLNRYASPIQANRAVNVHHDSFLNQVTYCLNCRWLCGEYSYIMTKHTPIIFSIPIIIIIIIINIHHHHHRTLCCQWSCYRLHW